MQSSFKYRSPTRISEAGESTVGIALIVIGFAISYYIGLAVYDYIQVVKAERIEMYNHGTPAKPGEYRPVERTYQVTY
jgi:hypothetical protein